MCFTTCYWELPRRTERSSSCCHLKISPTSSRYSTMCQLWKTIKQKTKHVLVLLVVLPLVSSKRGPCRFCKSSQLPAHTLCCMLMKFPLFLIRRALSPHPPQPQPPRVLLCSPPVLMPIWPCFHYWYNPPANHCDVFAAKLQDRRWRRPAARLWAASASDGNGGVPSRHQEAVSETVHGCLTEAWFTGQLSFMITEQ